MHLEGSDALIQSLIQKKVDALTNVAAALVTGGQMVEAQAKVYVSGPRPQRIDVVTERLRNSLAADDQPHLEGTDLVEEVGTDVPYGPVHEYGGGFIPARPYLRPALDENHDEILALLERAVTP